MRCAMLRALPLPTLVKSGSALVELLHALRQHDYSFTPVTPKTHATVLSRSSGGRLDLRDVFGWNRPFAENDLDPSLLSLLRQAKAVSFDGEQLKSLVRVA